MKMSSKGTVLLMTFSSLVRRASSIQQRGIQDGPAALGTTLVDMGPGSFDEESSTDVQTRDGAHQQGGKYPGVTAGEQPHHHAADGEDDQSDSDYCKFLP